MESNQRGGRGGHGGRPPHRGGRGRGLARGGPAQSACRGGRSRGSAFNSARRGNRESHNFREPCRQVQRDSRQGASSAEVLNAAGISTGHYAGRRPLLTGHGDAEGERGLERQAEVQHSDNEPCPASFAFPSYEEVTTGPRGNITTCSSVFELAKGGLVNHIHSCYKKAVKDKVIAVFGDLRVVPGRGLGRTISVTVDGRARLGTVGSTLALVGMKVQSVHYGEIAQVEKEQVFLFHNYQEVFNVEPTLPFTLVDTKLNTSFCLELSSVLASKKESLLLRRLWLGTGECADRTGPGSLTELSHPIAPAVLDQSQAEAFRAGVSEVIALIHAPSGCGAKTLLQAMIDYLCLKEQSLTKQPLLLIAQNPLQLQVKLRWTPDEVFNMNGKQMHEATKAAQHSLEAVMALGEVKGSLSRLQDLLLQMYEADTSILHQSSFEGITQAFARKRGEERNLLEGWLLDKVKYEEMRSSVSSAEFKRFQEHCKRRPVKKVDASEPSSENVCFTFDRSSQAQSGSHQQTLVPSDKNSPKATQASYVWKTLMATSSNADLMSVRDVRQLEVSDRWRLYKHWVVLFREMKQKELREAGQHLATSIERYKQVWMEARACLKLSQPVIMASPITAVTHRPLLEILKPRMTILCDATEIEDFCVPALLPRSTEKAIFMGDILKPCPTSSSCWTHLLKSGNFRVHELAFQYFQSQEICDLASPLLMRKMISRETPEQVNGVRETVQFFSIPDIKEAAFMMARLCIHLQAHNYESSDVAVLVLSPSLGPLKTLKQTLQQQGSANTVWTAKAFYPMRCKIAVIYFGRGSHGAQLAAALSRVTCAVYGFGDFSKADESCQNVINSAKARNASLFRGSLSLTCVCHPGQVISVASRHDFETKLDGYGFCLGPSSFVPRCGHEREVSDRVGQQVIASCQQPCGKTICKRNHRCPNKCSDPCSRVCTQLATEKLPMCGHDASMPCHQLDTVLKAQKRLLDVNGGSSTGKQSDVPYKCTVEIMKKRSCGHLLRTRCCDLLSKHCRVLVENILPTCGHVTRLACYMWDDPANLVGHKCSETVAVETSCGHPASVLCHTLDYRIKGQPRLPLWHKCTHETMKKAPCGHLVKAKCLESPSSDSSPCQECGKACWEMCNKQQGVQAAGSSWGASNCSQKVQSSQGAAAKTFPCGHPAPVERSTLGKPAELECQVPVTVTRQCGHILRLACSVSRRTSKFPPCCEMVEEPRPCGHKARRRCGDPPRDDVPSRCPVVIRKTLACGHPTSGPCWRIKFESPPCIATVEKVFRCGHSDFRLCSDSSPCASPCNTRLSCGHMCCKRCGGHIKHECRVCKDKCCVS
ncbi:unnamed protein product [Ixodes hexagonus]